MGREKLNQISPNHNLNEDRKIVDEIIKWETQNIVASYVLEYFWTDEVYLDILLWCVNCNS